MFFSGLLPLLLLLLLLNSEVDAYTADDDFSWAVRSTHLADPVRQKVYDEYMEGCRNATARCDEDERYRIEMNTYQPQAVRSFV